MKYNERIREIREDNFQTQQQIADLLHIGQRTYSDYESGKTRIPVDSLLILECVHGLYFRRHECQNGISAKIKILLCIHRRILSFYGKCLLCCRHNWKKYIQIHLFYNLFIHIVKQYIGINKVVFVFQGKMDNTIPLNTGIKYTMI